MKKTQNKTKQNKTKQKIEEIKISHRFFIERILLIHKYYYIFHLHI